MSVLSPPKIVWIYNGYFFESLFTIRAANYFKCPFILEFEDWHFSRVKFLALKSILDFLSWTVALTKFTACFAVNSFLVSKVRGRIGNTYLLPGIVSNNLLKAPKKQPFSSDQITVGYFGGLEIEKGLDIILELIESRIPSVKFIVCGAGDFSLEVRCKELAIKYPLLFEFCGRVSNEELYKKIGECDVILNPHKSIKKMKNGIFPFKVIEAIGSGRLVISTPLPPLESHDEILNSVYFVSDAKVDLFLKAIHHARIFYRLNIDKIIKSSTAAKNQFGEAALLIKIKELLNA